MDESAQLRLELEATKASLKEVTRKLNELKKLHHVFRLPFAGEGEDYTPDSVLSHCYGALLPMFTTKDALVLRLLCKEFKDTVTEFPWEDKNTLIKGSVAGWRACFPRAKCANLSRLGWQTSKLMDADLLHLVGVKWVDISCCGNITDAGFVHLKGVHTLGVSGCSQTTITDAAFAHLKGIHTLNMSKCRQVTITDLAFTHLEGIHTLDMSGCSQTTITDAAFAHMKGINTLNMSYCSQSTITELALSHLIGAKSVKGKYALANAAMEQGLNYTIDYIPAAIEDYEDYSGDEGYDDPHFYESNDEDDYY